MLQLDRRASSLRVRVPSTGLGLVPPRRQAQAVLFVLQSLILHKKVIDWHLAYPGKTSRSAEFFPVVLYINARMPYSLNMRGEKCHLIAGQRDINATYGVYIRLNEIPPKIVGKLSRAAMPLVDNIIQETYYIC